MKMIFAQGNPEPDYTSSRHNVGFSILNTIADEFDAKWTNKSKFNALTSEIAINDEKIILVKPTTFYNETGISVRKLVDFYKLNTASDLLVIHDDLSLPFGTVRVRTQGGDAGNNGIKSINSHLNNTYTRIKIGISNDLYDQMDDSNFVLSKFNNNESDQLEKTIIPHVSELVKQFCDETIKLASFKNIEKK